MKQDFYRAFEDRHRGSRETIKGRLEPYLPFVLPLSRLYPWAQVVDLGCGRGEWLELLGDHGITASGVDLDEGMLAACRERGMMVTHGDALRYLQQLPAASTLVVTGFHIAEHLPFDVLQALIAEACRVLLPGGVLVLETPNPENVVVGTANFYVDPTHLRPLPPLLMEFLPEFHGFARTKLMRLQGNPALVHATTIGLSEVLGGVSPDYAVVAQKAFGQSETGTQDDRDALEQAFVPVVGLSLQDLTGRYDRQVHDNRAGLDEARRQMAHSLELVRSTGQGLQAQAEAMRQAAEASAEAARKAVAQAQEAREAAHRLAVQMEKVYGSYLWLVAAPFFWLERLVRKPREAMKEVVKPVARRLAAFVLARPRLRQAVEKVLYATGLHGMLQRLIRRVAAEPAPAPAPAPPLADSWNISEDAETLNRQIDRARDGRGGR